MEPQLTSPLATLSHYQHWMELALKEAALAEAHGDIPVGAVMIYQNKIIAKAHNRKEIDLNPAGHAEILAIQQAAKTIGEWRLTKCTLVVTLEPCPMCASALVQSRIGKVIYGASDPQQGGLGGRLDVRTFTPGVTPKTTQVIGGVLQEQCTLQLEQFFKQQRKN
jgi:tRNA(adenine34) deaminase